MLLPDEQPWLIASQTWRQMQKILNRSSSTINRRPCMNQCKWSTLKRRMHRLTAQFASAPGLCGMSLHEPPLCSVMKAVRLRALFVQVVPGRAGRNMGKLQKSKTCEGKERMCLIVLRECVQEQARIGKAALEGMLLTTTVVFQSRAFLLTSFVIFVVCFLWPFCQSSGISFTSLCSFSNFDFLLLKPSMLDVPSFWHPFSPPLALAFVLTSLSLHDISS